MSIDNVQDITPRIQYVATGGQTIFPYPFPIFDDGDLVVDVDGAVLVITTNYTVSGAGDDNGGNVTLTAGATAGQIVTIYRDIAIERDTDFQQNGPWRSAAINDELDRMTLVDQQLELATTRALRVNVNDESDFDDLVLPGATARASRFLAFDSSGNPTVSVGTGADAGLREDIATGAAGAITFVDAVANMEALPGLVDGAIIHRAGYSSSRDGGDIFAEYVSGSSATPNLYDTFQPDTGGGRFLIIKTGGGPVDIRKAGAVGNGLTDASAACQSILDSGDSVFIPRSASGFVLGDINLALANQSIVGDPARSLIIAEDSDIFNIRASKVAIQNLDVSCTAMTTSAKTLFKLKTDLGSFESIYIDRIRPISCQCLIRDANSTGTVDELYIGDILAIGNRGPGLELNDVPAFLFVRRVTIDYAGINANHRAFSVANNDGSIFTDCDVSGSAQLGTVGSQDGFYFLNTTSPWLVRCHGDTCGRYGFGFENCQYVYLTSCTGSLNDSNALWIKNTQQVQVANSFFQGRRGLGFATASVSVGKIESDSQRISIVGGAFDSGTGHGLETAGSRVTTSSVRMFNNTSRGLKTNTSSSSVHAAPIFESNTAGNYDLATAFDHIGTGLANSGAVLNVTGPGAA